MTRKARSKRQQPISLGRRVLRVVLMVLISTGIGYGVYDLFQFCVRSDLFLVREVRIAGNELLTKSEIVRQMEVPSKVRLWQIEPEQIQARLMKLDLIHTVQVRRVLPQTLIVEVLERKPMAVWKDPVSEERFVLDEKRWLLCTVGEFEERLSRSGVDVRQVGPLPLVVCHEGVHGWAPGDRLDVDGLEDLLGAYDVLLTRGEPWIAAIERFELLDPVKGWTIRCRELAEEIRLGREDLTRRIGRVDPVWKLLTREQMSVAYIDLRFEEQGAVIKPHNYGVRNWMKLNGFVEKTAEKVG